MKTSRILKKKNKQVSFDGANFVLSRKNARSTIVEIEKLKNLVSTEQFDKIIRVYKEIRKTESIIEVKKILQENEVSLDQLLIIERHVEKFGNEILEEKV